MEHSSNWSCPFRLSPEVDTVDFGALENELLGSFDVEEDGPHFVCTMTPLGEMFWTFFTAQQWRTICEIAALDGKEVEQAVEEVVIEKYHRMKNELGDDED